MLDENYVNKKDMNTIQNVRRRFTREELFKVSTARTFPQITAHGEYIGGYTEFEQWSDGLRRV